MKQPKRYCIDTNVFLRVFIRENEVAFNQCYRLLEKVKSGDVVACTHDLVLTEIVWTLQSVYGQSKQIAIRAAESVVNLHGLELVSGYDARRALKLYKTYSVKYVDACLAAVDEVAQKQTAIVSYDTDFKKLPIMWTQPKDVFFSR